MIETYFFLFHIFSKGITERKMVRKSLTVLKMCRFDFTAEIG
jgi:hypothetical protein